jgi:Raf kinase inhibitor-like YbhB/YbcL family protein
MAFIMKSPAFADGHPIPARYTRDGENVSPALEWSGAPGETQSYAVIVEDPDAPSGTFQHWAIYNIPGDRTALPEGAGSGAQIGGLSQGVNDFGNARYDGPQPPRGHGPHHYHFRLAALNIPRLDVPASAKVVEVWEAARPHIVGETELVGTYER